MSIQVVSSDSFARPTNTTAYAAGDSVAPAALTITAASNASPIVITSTAHGLATGDRVTVASVGGNTAANGDWVITKVDADTFRLDGSTGNGTYTSGGTAVRLLRLQSLSIKGATQGTIVKTRLVCNSATVTNGTFRVTFYKSQVSQIADNAAWTLLYANRASIIGHTGTLTLVTEGAGSDAGMAIDLTAIPFVLGAGVTHLFAVITALAAYGPTSGETFYLEVTVSS
jgi:hypothetical protein